MKRTTKAAPKASRLYARVRQILDRNTKLLVFAKGHALRDEFGEAPTTAGPMNRQLKTALPMEGDPIGYSLRSTSAEPQTKPRILDAPRQISDVLRWECMSIAPASAMVRIRHVLRGESWYPGHASLYAAWERASHGG